MSHQTGIQASADLKDAFSEARQGATRMVKVVIREEQLELAATRAVSGTWEDDYDECVVSAIEERHPCYIVYRLDSRNAQGYEWLFISYSPDDASVREKMLFAGTRSTLKTEFGTGHIKGEIFGTAPHEISLAGYKRHLVAQSADAPLTMAELELAEVRRSEVNADISTSSRSSNLPGVSFPIADAAVTELIRVNAREVAYVQLSLDVEKEIINLVTSCDANVSDLSTLVPKEEPRYHFFIFKHTHEGDYLESIVFIYSMPGYKCSVKERMLYSSCKAPLLSACEDVLKMEIAKKLEIGEEDNLTAEFLQDELHPIKNVVRPKFSKPKGPLSRGPKRMTKNAE